MSFLNNHFYFGELFTTSPTVPGPHYPPKSHPSITHPTVHSPMAALSLHTRIRHYELSLTGGPRMQLRRAFLPVIYTSDNLAKEFISTFLGLQLLLNISVRVL